MMGFGWLASLLAVTMYGIAIIGFVLLVQAVVRIGHTLTRINDSLEELSVVMRSDTSRR